MSGKDARLHHPGPQVQALRGDCLRAHKACEMDMGLAA